jgi:hypothetical protein
MGNHVLDSSHMLVFQRVPDIVYKSGKSLRISEKHCENIASLKGRSGLPDGELITEEVVETRNVSHFS